MADHIRVLYESILNVTKEIKSNLMIELASSIPFLSEGLPTDVVRELDILSTIDGCVLSMLKNRGREILPVPGKEGYVSVKIGEESYIVHQSKLRLRYPDVEEKQKEDQIPPAEELQAEETTPVTENQNSDPAEEEFDFEKEDIPDFEENALEDYTEYLEEEDPAGEPEEKNAPQETLEPLKATVIGGDYIPEPVVAPMSRADVFVEEKRKAASEFVFDSYKLSVRHMESRAEDMQFMIAPLKIQKYACPTVPIIVSIYYKGKIYSASSFDKNEDGRNIVRIEVNEYYFLCRGSFNDKGEFQSSIVTTGISANQGDVINILSHKKYAPAGSSVKNGHVKFRYNGEDGPGIIEIFPLEIGKDDFVVMTRCGEFVEYIPMSNASHGLNRALIYDAGARSEIVCTWDGDFLEADIVPV